MRVPGRARVPKPRTALPSGTAGYSGAVSEIPFRSVAEFIALAPGDAEWARRAVEPYGNMTPAERLRALSALNGWMDRMLAGRLPEREDGEHPFWMHWKDPLLARPR